MNIILIKTQENKKGTQDIPIFLHVHVTITSLPQLLAISLANIHNKADHTRGNFGRL